MSIPDPIALIVELLKANEAIAALAGANVFGGGLPAGFVMPQAAVVVTPAGGPGRRGAEGWRRNRIDTICYGATLHESWEVHLAVREALETMPPTGALKEAHITSDGSNALDPVELWPTAYASYLVLSTVTA